MRVGWNPIKRMRRGGQPRRVTVATVTHVPFLAGFYAQGLDVLKLMLASLRANTGEPVDLMVLDNASCAEVQDYLVDEHRQGAIQYLILSGENSGVLAAHNFLFRAAPGEFIAYADGDVFFHPGWLEASLQVLETFPKAGVVSGVPIHHRSNIATASILAWAQNDPGAQLETGRLIPLEWTADQCEGFGREVDEYLAERQAIDNYRITYNGVRAYAGAYMNQFVGRKTVIEQTVPFSEEWLLHGAGGMQTRLDELGFLVLAADGLYVHHLGNTLDDKWRAVAAQMGVPLASTPLPADPSRASRAARRPLLRRVLLRVYDGLFRLLYRGALAE